MNLPESAHKKASVKSGVDQLGIPHGFAVMHGKTRRGALVFGVADLVKDALVLPLAFICAKENSTEQECIPVINEDACFLDQMRSKLAA